MTGYDTNFNDLQCMHMYSHTMYISVSSVTLNSSHYNPIEPGATPTLTCTAVVDPLYYNLTSIPLSVSWSGPVYGTGEFNTTGVQKVSDTIYVSRAILNSQGTYYDSGVYTCATNEHVRATTTGQYRPL